MFGSLLFAVLMVPMLSKVLIKRPKVISGGHGDVFVMRWLLKVYKPLVIRFVHRPKMAVTLAGGLVAIGVILFMFLGSEFVPRLNEGDLLVRATMAPSISIDEARDSMLRFEKRLMGKFPEVQRVVTRVGRGEVGAHADPINSAEAFVQLKPKEQWKTAHTLEQLTYTMSEAFEDFPGVQFNFTQPIAAAVDELLTGIKADLAIKIFGPDMEVLKETAGKIESVIKGIPGAADVQKDQVSGTPQLRIMVDKRAISRYGINVKDVQEIIHAAVGGDKAGQVFEGVKRFDILVRYRAENRETAEAIGRILVPAPAGPKVPLVELAIIEEIVGPRQITREQNQRFTTVQCNVRNRDIGSFVKEAQGAIEGKVKLPSGYFVKWGGQFELQKEANKRLALVVPVTLLIVFLLLYSSFNSIKNSSLILLNVPLALVGGVAGLFITGQHLSVPASVGFIALFGIALANGMVLVTYLNQLLREGKSMEETCIHGAVMRLRPVLMTALAAALGLVPMVLSSGTGSEVQRPLATVVIGGLVTSTVLTLLVIPALYRWFAINPEEDTVMK
jgi:cobalt-zinc-cadmium resistance protein CzcA